MKKRTFTTALLTTLLVGFSMATLQFSSAAEKTLRIGIMSGEDEDVWRGDHFADLRAALHAVR